MTTQSSRRAFLRQAARFSALGAAAPLGLNLAGLAHAAAQSSGNSDYKAIVCLFMLGGNDHYNTVVPFDAASNALYATRRPALAYGPQQLAATALNSAADNALPFGQQFALSPTMGSLVPLFNAGKLAVTLNTGTLIQPVTKKQVVDRSAPLPPKLMSHNDQQSLWQSSLAEGATTGWGGRIADLMQSGNTEAAFTAVNAGGRAIWVSGESAMAYSVSPGGSIPITAIKEPLFGSHAASNLIRDLLTESRSGALEEAYNSVVRRSIAADATLSQALAGATPLSTVFDNTNPLAAQLSIVARMMSARQTMGLRRQVFMVSMGGFDTHDHQEHELPALQGQVSQAMASFNAAMVELGLDKQVTLFTASDFGRTLVSNGDGTDHGWGTHQFVMGGAVKGGRFYGTAPSLEKDSANDMGNGRLIPTTGADQVSGALARWFGVSNSDLPAVLPNIGRFNGVLPMF